MRSTWGLSMRSRNCRAYAREGLHVAPLALGVQRVEDQRGLAGAGHAGDHDQLVGREVEVDVAEVVLARAADADRGAAGGGILGRHGGFLRRGRGGGSLAGGLPPPGGRSADIARLSHGGRQRWSSKWFPPLPRRPRSVPTRRRSRVGNTVYLSGQIGLDPAAASWSRAASTPRSHRAFRNLQAVARGGRRLAVATSSS